MVGKWFRAFSHVARVAEPYPQADDKFHKNMVQTGASRYNYQAWRNGAFFEPVKKETMPSPLGHSLMGYIICEAANRPSTAHRWKLIPLCLFAANAPDLDFLPGLIIGQPGRYHHGPSHSIAFALFFGAVAAALFSRRIYAFGMGFSLYLSHVLLDYLVQDPSAPFGVPLFWPVRDSYHMAPFAFYRPFHYPVSFMEPVISTIFSLHNLATIITEIIFLMPLLILLSWYKRSLAGSSSASHRGLSRRSAEE